jgi:putative oxidoreductase
MVGGQAAICRRERRIMDARQRNWDKMIFLLSLVLATVFIYAGISKFRDPLQFADSIAAFALLPATFVNLVALSIPPLEVVCGLLLLWSSSRRLGALTVGVASAIFFIALASALLRGLTLDCGCFGAGAPSRPGMWLELALDAVLGAASLLIYLRSIARSSAADSLISAGEVVKAN